MINRRSALQGAALALSLSSPTLAKESRQKRKAAVMPKDLPPKDLPPKDLPPKDSPPKDLSPDEVISLLNLEPNATCGFVRVTYTSKLAFGADALPRPFARSGPIGSALYFLVTPHAPVRLHRIRNDQLYHYYLGDPLELFLLRADGSSERVVVGPDLRGGQRVQLLIPGDTFHTARLLGEGRWFLGASTEWPGVVPADVEIGNLDQLAEKHPGVAPEMRSIAASARDVKPTASAPR